MAIKFQEVSHFYEKAKRNEFLPAAISNISFDIAEKGEFVMIMGHTGSGKSTLMQHINGLLLPTSGEVRIGDLVITNKKRKNPKMKPIRQKIGFVFQFPEYQLFEETVLKDIIYGPKNFGYSDEEAKKEAIKVAKMLNITSILNQSPFNLSGGQMRKVAIAGILAYNPDVLLLDEPTRGLDPLGAKEIMAFFKELQVKYHKTIIMISHDMDLVYEYATRCIVLQNGELVYDGDKETLFAIKYAQYKLDKPRVLKVIDYLNQNTDYQLSYQNYNLNDLLSSLKGGDTHE